MKSELKAIRLLPLVLAGKMAKTEEEKIAWNATLGWAAGVVIVGVILWNTFGGAPTYTPPPPNCRGVQQLPAGQEYTWADALADNEPLPGNSEVADAVRKNLAGPYGADKDSRDLQSIDRVEIRISAMRTWAATQPYCVAEEYNSWLNIEARSLASKRAEAEFQRLPKPPEVK
jgi:hypothetical protein